RHDNLTGRFNHGNVRRINYFRCDDCCFQNREFLKIRVAAVKKARAEKTPLCIYTLKRHVLATKKFGPGGFIAFRLCKFRLSVSGFVWIRREREKNADSRGDKERRKIIGNGRFARRSWV